MLFTYLSNIWIIYYILSPICYSAYSCFAQIDSVTGSTMKLQVWQEYNSNAADTLAFCKQTWLVWTSHAISTCYIEWCSWFISICTSQFISNLLRTIIIVMLIIRQMIWCILCCLCCLFFSFLHFRRWCHLELLRLRKYGYSIHGAWNE